MPDVKDSSLNANQLVVDAKSQIKEIDVDALRKALSSNSTAKHDYLLIDVREPYELMVGKIPDAVNIPRGRLEFDIWQQAPLKLLDLDDPENKVVASQLPIYLYCRSGGRSALAAKSLQDIGFENVHSVAGGFSAWQASKFATD
ncbi:MAG: rhodanese-like domain-containing protein [Gammaproteobacteria bacterium]|nr:rhodanese-like domain-containing protein [Gammaproteobacteria bacterium]